MTSGNLNWTLVVSLPQAVHRTHISIGYDMFDRPIYRREFVEGEDPLAKIYAQAVWGSKAIVT